MTVICEIGVGLFFTFFIFNQRHAEIRCTLVKAYKIEKKVCWVNRLLQRSILFGPPPYRSKKKIHNMGLVGIKKRSSLHGIRKS
jgi:hypothetical protein